jgi:hypothetical protein
MSLLQHLLSLIWGIDGTRDRAPLILAERRPPFTR